MAAGAPVTVFADDDSPAVGFTASELKRYLSALDWSAGTASIELKVEPRPGDHPFDDRIRIEVKKGTGVICGNNPRSVLIAAYRYLKEIGWQFPFPGVEVVPDRNNAILNDVVIVESPEYRYRGLCIEGSNSVEIISGIIDFLPKLGLNCYLVQFRQAYVFFKRWHRNIGSPDKEDLMPYPPEDAEKCVEAVAEQIRKRGLIYHAVGHGWTCDPFGVPGLEWQKWEGPIPDEAKEFFALVGGKRDLADGVPLNTSLCYSNPEARRIVVQDVVKYAREHPFVDVIHVWGPDSVNHQCECDSCVKQRPSDWYVLLLNEIDAALALSGIDAKIVFGVYTDVLWPPVTGTLHNPDRFIMMFAPISRSYRTAFETGERGDTPRFELNKLTLPETVAENLALFDEWKSVFPGDALDFDYHYMWAHHKDAGGMSISRVLHEDARKLHNLGLDGYISCQVQRAMTPNSLGITVLAQALWGPCSFEQVRVGYFNGIYGEYAGLVEEQLDNLSDLCYQLDLENPGVLSNEKAAICNRLTRFAQDYIDVLSGENAPAGIAFDILRFHYALWSKLSRALERKFSGDNDMAAAKWEEARMFLWHNGDRFAQYIDSFNFDRTFKEVFEA